MKQTIVIKAEPRVASGKGGARATRRAGRVPAVVYGHGREPAPLSISGMELDRALQDVTGGSTVIDLEVEGKTVQTLIREVQRHPTKQSVTHIDFYEIHAGEVIEVDVPIRLIGIPDGVRNAGGVLEQFLRELQIEVLPKDIPEAIELDVTNLKVGSSLHVSDLQVPNAEVLEDGDTTICTVSPPRVEEEVAPVEGLVEEVAEPELIRKPREDEEAEEDDES